MWLLKTLVFSSILGIALGTTAGLTAQLLTPIYTNIPQVQVTKIILASDNNTNNVPTIGHEIIAAQIISSGEQNLEVTPTPETESIVTESIQSAVVVETKEENSAASPTPEENTPQTAEEPKLGLNAAVLSDLINQYRQKLGLESFQSDQNLCSLAQTRAAELTNEFSKGILHSGLYSRNLPYWITENAILMRTEELAFQWWLNSPVHRGQIQGDYKYSCLACSGYECSQVFTNFTPKIKHLTKSQSF